MHDNIAILGNIKIIKIVVIIVIVGDWVGETCWFRCFAFETIDALVKVQD